MSFENSTIEVKPGSAKSFGYVFTAAFAVIGLLPLVSGGGVRSWSIVLSGVFLAVTLIRPALLEKPNYWWFRFGMLLGGFIAPIVMGLVYVVTIVPMGLIMRGLRRDLLRIRIDKDAPSYWIARDTPLQPMKNQF